MSTEIHDETPEDEPGRRLGEEFVPFAEAQGSKPLVQVPVLIDGLPPFSINFRVAESAFRQSAAITPYDLPEGFPLIEQIILGESPSERTARRTQIADELQARGFIYDGRILPYLEARYYVKGMLTDGDSYTFKPEYMKLLKRLRLHIGLPGIGKQGQLMWWVGKPLMLNLSLGSLAFSEFYPDDALLPTTTFEQMFLGKSPEGGKSLILPEDRIEELTPRIRAKFTLAPEAKEY